MIKHHKVEVIFSTESDLYQRIEGIATRTGASVETVLELLLNKALMQHVENNIDWVEALTKECFESCKSEQKEVKTIQAVDVETEYFPEDLRKKYKLGEYAED